MAVTRSAFLQQLFRIPIRLENKPHQEITSTRTSSRPKHLPVDVKTAWPGPNGAVQFDVPDVSRDPASLELGRSLPAQTMSKEEKPPVRHPGRPSTFRRSIRRKRRHQRLLDGGDGTEFREGFILALLGSLGGSTEFAGGFGPIIPRLYLLSGQIHFFPAFALQ